MPDAVTLRILLAGATGLVGRAALRRALADARVDRVVAPTRRPLPPHPKLENPQVDFDALPADASWWMVDGVMCTLGTTIRTAGSQAAFRRVDHDYVVAVATLARAHGARAFALTSAMGASPTSRIFYNRTKGETERSVAACGYRSFTIVRPGVIGGEREESRPAEFVALRVLRALGPLLPRRYRISPAERIADALLTAAIDARPGQHLIGAAELA
jgi:uncharacterized protein YbjT (DUF2867 family)